MRALRRVLLTTDCIGGVWTFTVELCRELNRFGVECVVASMGRMPDDRERSEIRNLPGTSLFTSEYALEWMNNPWADVDRAADWLLNLAADQAVDLIHLNGFTHATLPWERPVLVVGHSCVSSWFAAVAPGEAGHIDPEYRRRVAAGLTAADLVVAPTHVMLAALRRHYDWQGLGQVIRNGIRKPNVSNEPKQNIVLSAGRAWDRAKGIDRLVAGSKSARWPIHVFGSTGNLETESQLRWHGRQPREKVLAWLQRARIYAAPARYEPFGLAVLEAAHCRCCLLLSDIASLRENWDGAAQFVPNSAGADWSRAINQLIHSPERWDELSESAQQRAQIFSSRRMGERYSAAYRWLVSKTSRPARAEAA